MSNEIYKKNPGKFGPKSVIGRYIRSMNMAQYRDFTYADTDRINFQDNKQEKDQLSQEEKDAREAALRQRYEAGEISESEYKDTRGWSVTYVPLTSAEKQLNFK